MVESAAAGDGASQMTDAELRGYQMQAAICLAREDLRGLHLQHATMWRLFTVHIRSLVAVLGGPVLLLGILISAKAIKTNADLGQLPRSVGLVLLGSAFLGSFLMHILVRYRLDMLMYARAINSFRRDYVKILNKKDEAVISPAMPVTVDAPKPIELVRPGGLLAAACTAITSLYFFLGVWIVTHHDWRTAIFVAVLIGVANYTFYIVASVNRPIAGDPRSPYTDPEDWRDG